MSKIINDLRGGLLFDFQDRDCYILPSRFHRGVP